MPTSEGQRNVRTFLAAFKVVLVVVLIIGANHAVDQLQLALNIDIRPSNEDTIHRMVLIAAVLYIITLAIPFMPGVEIGLGLMAILGLPIVPLVYVCTVTGLSLGFLFGLLIPLATLAQLCHDLRLTRAEKLLRRFHELPESEKLSFLLSASSNRPMQALIRHRYVALALLINLPGNFVIGGGGGIAMIAGASRLFWWPLFLLTLAIAVAPVPLAILLLGPSVLTR